MVHKNDADAGAAIYTRQILSIYDVAVVGFSNQLVWCCPASVMVDFYNANISANHLDVGVGTGYYLDKCRFPTPTPRIDLLDLNPNSLNVTAQRLQRYAPTTHLANVLEPLSLDTMDATFDSIALGYLLHCLPGTMVSKQIVFDNLKPLLNPNGVLFGTTILGQNIQPNPLAWLLMRVYNSRAIFSNTEDTLANLEAGLKQHFKDYAVKVVGCVALFTGRN